MGAQNGVAEKPKVEKPDYKAQLQASQKELAKVQQELTEALAVNEKLVAEIEVLTEGKTPEAVAKTATGNLLAMVFELDGIKYGFAIPQVKHKGVLITPTEVCADAALQQDLISKKSGMIKQL